MTSVHTCDDRPVYVLLCVPMLQFVVVLNPAQMKQRSLKSMLTPARRERLSGSSSSSSSAARSSPRAKKKRKTIGKRPEHMRSKPRKRIFQSSWQTGRAWLQYDEHKGMWCSLCHKHRAAAAISGPVSRRNALVNPTTYYSYRNVQKHADGPYHLAAVALESRMSTCVSTMQVQLPTAIIPQVKVVFRTVVYMVKSHLAHRQLHRLLALHKANGVVYTLRYKSSYCVVLLKFLGAMVRKYLRRLWIHSVWRAVRTDEVKVGIAQWLFVTARIFVDQKFHTLPIATCTLPAEGRDAPAIEEALNTAPANNGITIWLDTALVGVTVDGASVLLSALTDRLRNKAPHALPWYRAAHRTQRVDADVTEVPKAERTNQDAATVRAGAKRLNSMLSKTSKFFSVSTKRWAAQMGQQGPVGVKR